MKEYTGSLSPGALRFAIVVSRFNEIVTKQLLSGAVEGLIRHGVDGESITVVWVPGALEIPVAAKACAASEQYDAIICLGAVIQGETAHFDVVVTQSAAGIAAVALDYDIPVINEILAGDTLEQLQSRAGGKHGNKGYEAACIAIETANVLARLNEGIASYC